jgi:nicotinate-nucleotide adenylyltransferase
MHRLVPRGPDFSEKKVVLIGGSFDPIHVGHLQMAKSAQAHCMADEVWFVPAGQPWQKQRQLASNWHRTEMLKLAITGAPSWFIHTSELEREGNTYTVDTLEDFSNLYPAHTFTWIIGGDQVRNLPTWHNWESLFDFANIGMVERAGVSFIEIPPTLQKYHDKAHLIRIPMPTIAVSSTEIRRQAALLAHANTDIRETAKTRLRNCLPRSVADYIEVEKLYQTPETEL